MDTMDFLYFAHRAEKQRMMARLTRSGKAAMAHREIARLCAERADDAMNRLRAARAQPSR